MLLGTFIVTSLKQNTNNYKLMQIYSAVSDPQGAGIL